MVVITDLLNAKAEDIEIALKKKDTEDNGFIERTLYCQCIKEMKNIKNLSDLKSEEFHGIFKGITTAFLINWGNMRRVLGGSCWQEGLRREIIEIRDDLEKIRTKDIVNNDLNKYENEIKNCYSRIINYLTETTHNKGKQKSKKYQYTATSKVLHLIAPDFFPMWDNNIRKKTISETKNKMKYNWKKYYEFMERIKDFMNDTSFSSQRPTTIKELSTNHKYGYTVSKLRIVDRYFWIIAHNSDK